MKKLMTSAMVLAIVGSAFAFTAKRAGAFCVSNTGANQNCFVLKDHMIVEGNTNFWYQQNWNGNRLTCPGNCPTPIRLIENGD
jgi:hypothetical protein